ncbi:MAG: hypothetical protein LBQ70_01055 [Prevotellaceae bacterium]|nr:hypothetical protein [Prevotellaceae bacterium]
MAVLFCSVALTAQSQEFKPFRVDGGLGYGIPVGDNYDAGLTFYLEPKYAVLDKIAVGLRWEGSLFAGATDDETSASASLSSGYLVTGDYYFNNNKFRPFAGIGLGLHRIAGASASINVGAEEVELSTEGKTNFGGLIRAGADFAHMRLTLSYNYAGKIGDETHHYLGVTFGFFIGGGRK